jgi:RpiR family transcriptional regulator, carbohydrate utilization regulator
LEMANSIFSLIKSKYNILSAAQKVIADFIFNNSEKVIMLSIGELASECNTSQPTIMRFLTKLDFSSYQVFKIKLAQEFSTNNDAQNIYESIRSNDTIEEIRQKVIMSTVKSIDDLNNLLEVEDLNKSIDLIYQAKKILFIGVGDSASIAQDGFHKFLRLGLNAFYNENLHIMHVCCAQADKNDVIILVSNSGESIEIINCASLAKENNSKIIALTSYKTSSLTKFVDIILLSSANERKYHTDSMVSRIMQLVIFDILYVGVMLKLKDKGIKNINKSRLAVAKYKA